MRFVCSFSGGKDSALALYRAVQAGHAPTKLLVTCNADRQHSWFHNIPYPLLQEVAGALRIPLLMVQTESGRYAGDFESALRKCKAEGAEMCVFGDIDIQEHYDWCHGRCLSVGMRSGFPLWGEPRPDVMRSFLRAGFSAMITVVDTSRMDARYAGQVLTPALVSEMEADGVDVSGEQGEYHTFVYDGPLFERKVRFAAGEPEKKGQHVRIPISQ